MKQYKLAFVGNSESPEYLLNLFKKMTPGNSGEWGQLRGVNNYRDADYFMVIDWLPPNLGIDPKKCVFLGAHPPTMQAYRNMNNYICLAKFDCAKTFGFGEWWISRSYDELMAMKPPTKSKTLCAIVSNARTQYYHINRINWLQRFCKNNNNLDFNLYGRIEPSSEMKKYYRGPCGDKDGRGFAASGKDHMIGKEKVLETHKYIVDFDAEGQNYFSERIFDDLLLFCIPVVYGGSGIHNYLPQESFNYLDINGNGKDVLDIIEKNDYEQRLPYIIKARNILLNELSCWGRTHLAIFGTCK